MKKVNNSDYLKAVLTEKVRHQLKLAGSKRVHKQTKGSSFHTIPNDVVELIATGCPVSQEHKWISKKQLDNFVEKSPSRSITNNDTASASSSERPINQKTPEAGRACQRKYRSFLVLFSMFFPCTSY